MAKPRGQCLQCGARLALYLRLKDSEFCSAEHRRAFRDEQQRLALERLAETERMISQARGGRNQTLAKPASDAFGPATPDDPADVPQLAAMLYSPQLVSAKSKTAVAALMAETCLLRVVFPAAPALSSSRELQRGQSQRIRPRAAVFCGQIRPTACEYMALPSLCLGLPAEPGMRIRRAVLQPTAACSSARLKPFEWPQRSVSTRTIEIPWIAMRHSASRIPTLPSEVGQRSERSPIARREPVECGRVRMRPSESLRWGQAATALESAPAVFTHPAPRNPSLLSGLRRHTERSPIPGLERFECGGSMPPSEASRRTSLPIPYISIIHSAPLRPTLLSAVRQLTEAAPIPCLELVEFARGSMAVAKSLEWEVRATALQSAPLRPTRLSGVRQLAEAGPIPYLELVEFARGSIAVAKSLEWKIRGTAIQTLCLAVAHAGPRSPKRLSGLRQLGEARPIAYVGLVESPRESMAPAKLEWGVQATALLALCLAVVHSTPHSPTRPSGLRQLTEAGPIPCLELVEFAPGWEVQATALPTPCVAVAHSAPRSPTLLSGVPQLGEAGSIPCLELAEFALGSVPPAKSPESVLQTTALQTPYMAVAHAAPRGPTLLSGVRQLTEARPIPCLELVEFGRESVPPAKSPESGLQTTALQTPYMAIAHAAPRSLTLLSGVRQLCQRAQISRIQPAEDGRRQSRLPERALPVWEPERGALVIPTGKDSPRPQCATSSSLVSVPLYAVPARTATEQPYGEWLRTSMPLNLGGLENHHPVLIRSTSQDTPLDRAYPFADSLIALPATWRSPIVPAALCRTRDFRPEASFRAPGGAFSSPAVGLRDRELQHSGLIATRFSLISPPLCQQQGPVRCLSALVRLRLPGCSTSPALCNPDLRDVLPLKWGMHPSCPQQRERWDGMPRQIAAARALPGSPAELRTNALQQAQLLPVRLSSVASAQSCRSGGRLRWPSVSPAYKWGPATPGIHSPALHNPDSGKLFALKWRMNPNRPLERSPGYAANIPHAPRPTIGSSERKPASRRLGTPLYRSTAPSVRFKVGDAKSSIFSYTVRRRMLLILLPAVIATSFIAILRGSPADKSSGPGAFSIRWTALQQRLSSRAGVLLVDDFRSGLDSWVGQGEAAGSWTLDETGFVKPVKIAIFRPSMGLADYSMEFLAQVDKKALNWVFRAKDPRNFQVVKLMIARPGPLPTLVLRRYAVLDGRETLHKDTVLPITVRGDALFDVNLEAHGADFSVRVQGRLVDSWTDGRLPSGGVGFFSGKGESSRIRWVHFQHQYDVLGRICAYLSPAAVAANSTAHSNGSWE